MRKNVDTIVSDPLLLDGLDPLNEFKRSEDMDPLTKIAMEENVINVTNQSMKDF